MNGADGNPIEDRLLTFEIGATLYALPISGVLEVTDLGKPGCIPTVAPDVAGVINYHGDALPVVHRGALFEQPDGALPEPEQMLVITDRSSGAPRLGVAVDRVLGLVDGSAAVSRGAHPVAERRVIGGRLAGVLDPQRLVARAREAIEQSLVRAD